MLKLQQDTKIFALGGTKGNRTRIIKDIKPIFGAINMSDLSKGTTGAGTSENRLKCTILVMLTRVTFASGIVEKELMVVFPYCWVQVYPTIKGHRQLYIPQASDNC